MNDEKILKKAIENAKNNGFKILNKHLADYNMFSIIFSHDFAKAFWGEEGDWKYNLQQMVIRKEPIKYLEKFLTN